MMVPNKHLISRASVQTQVCLTADSQLGRDRMGFVTQGKFEDDLVLMLMWQALSDCVFFLLSEDLVAQNIDVVLSRRNCMVAALRIIEENIPEVRLWAQY